MLREELLAQSSPTLLSRERGERGIYYQAVPLCVRNRVIPIQQGGNKKSSLEAHRQKIGDGAKYTPHQPPALLVFSPHDSFFLETPLLILGRTFKEFFFKTSTRSGPYSFSALSLLYLLGSTVSTACARTPHPNLPGSY